MPLSSQTLPPDGWIIGKEACWSADSCRVSQRAPNGYREGTERFIHDMKRAGEGLKQLGESYQSLRRAMKKSYFTDLGSGAGATGAGEALLLDPAVPGRVEHAPRNGSVEAGSS